MALAEREFPQVMPLQAQMRAAMLAAVRAVDEEFGGAQITAKLLEMPAKIRGLKDAVNEARQAVEAARSDVEQARAVIVAQIASEINPVTGKPAYSNEEARRAEFIRRAALDEDYKVAAEALRMAEDSLSIATFDLERAQDEFAALQAAARIAAGRMALMAQ